MFSRQQWEYMLSCKCPLCHERTLSGRFVRAGGTSLATLERLIKMATAAGRSDIFLECTRCHGRWPQFASEVVPTAGLPQNVEVTETHRSEEFIGDENRLIDNAQSSATLSRSLTLSREWSRSYVVEEQKKWVGSGGITLGQENIAGLKLAAEKTLETRYSITQTSKQVYTEQVTLNVPANCRLRLSIVWKRVWQHGLVTFRHSDGSQLQIPFQIAVGLTFDQKQTTA